jgi:hypothetical protein
MNGFGRFIEDLSADGTDDSHKAHEFIGFFNEDLLYKVNGSTVKEGWGVHLKINNDLKDIDLFASGWYNKDTEWRKTKPQKGKKVNF